MTYFLGSSIQQKFLFNFENRSIGGEQQNLCFTVAFRVFVFAETSVRSSRKLFTFVIKCEIHRIKASQNGLFYFENKFTDPFASCFNIWFQAVCLIVLASAFFLAEISVRSPRKLFIFIICKNLSGSKCPKNTLFDFENRRTGFGFPVARLGKRGQSATTGARHCSSTS